MNVKCFAFVSALTTAFAVASLAPQPAAGQGRAGGTQTSSTVAAGPWTVPRTADGQPDLQGVWLNTSATPFERPEALAGRQFLTDDEVAELSRRANRIFKENDADLAIGDGLYLAALADVDAFRRRGANRSSNFMVDREFDNRTSLIVDPPDGKLPALMPAAVERLAAITARDLDPAGPEDLNPRARCVTPGMPRIGPGPRGDPLYGYYQIFQSPGYFVLVMETNHDARIVRLDGSPPLSPRIRQWHGDSRGRWDGDTLVIETANFSSRSNFLGAAENLHLVERLTRVASDAIRYEVTVDDPTTWARPWTAAVRLKRQDANIYEFACHEGNGDIMLSILAIARAYGPRGGGGTGRAPRTLIVTGVRASPPSGAGGVSAGEPPRIPQRLSPDHSSVGLNRPPERASDQDPMSVVGQSRPRIDAVERVSGAARYTGDVKLPGMAYARVLRSPHPHARITSIDTRRAREMSGVYAVLTRENCDTIWRSGDQQNPRHLFGPVRRGSGSRRGGRRPPRRRRRFQAIEVDYEALDFVLDPEEALQPGAVEIQPGGNLSHRRDGEALPEVYQRGSVDTGFAAAAVVMVEETCVSKHHNNAQMEPCTAMDAEKVVLPRQLQLDGTPRLPREDRAMRSAS